jgi:hypothetical protein
MNEDIEFWKSNVQLANKIIDLQSRIEKLEGKKVEEKKSGLEEILHDGVYAQFSSPKSLANQIRELVKKEINKIYLGKIIEENLFNGIMDYKKQVEETIDKL